MNILITGICGFVGSQLALAWKQHEPATKIIGIDNLSRPGVTTNLPLLKHHDIKVQHGDLRCASDLETLPPVDWVIDAAANPSVLAGVDGKTSTRQLVEHNLLGTVNLLEYVKHSRAGLILLSTSRVYGIKALASLPMIAGEDTFTLNDQTPLPAGVSKKGIDESFSNQSPLSLYGATKLASETLALEYGSMLTQPVIINRCGVLAGAGQFGTAEQGIFSYWIRAYALKMHLRYIGFQGTGLQVRDALHPQDLAALVLRQIRHGPPATGVWNVGGGADHAMSLKQLSQWCTQRFGPHEVMADPHPRPFDVPWVIMDSSKAQHAFDWKPRITLPDILEEIARHHETHPDWLMQSQSF